MASFVIFFSFGKKRRKEERKMDFFSMRGGKEVTNTVAEYLKKCTISIDTVVFERETFLWI